MVSQLLRKHGYRRRKALKKKTMGHHRDRNAQFEKIARLKKKYLKAGLPVISIDTKKKELLGDFYRDGRIDTQETIEINDHDFGSAGSGVVIPHGVYDMARNRGFLHSEHQPRHQRTGLRQHRGVVGTARADGLPSGRRNSWCCATAAAATVRRGTCSRRNFRSWRIGWASRSAWPTTRPTAPSTTRSSTACFPM